MKPMDNSTFSQLNLVTDSQTNLVSLGYAAAANVDPKSHQSVGRVVSPGRTILDI